MTEKSGIYAIRHVESGKVYIGSASNISKRWSRHRKELRLGTHKNKHLQAAWTKYGEEAFVFEMLELTSNLDKREQYWIDTVCAIDPEKGYNFCPTARSTRGIKTGPRSQEFCERQKQALKGKCGFGIATPIRQGKDNHQSKLTEEIVREIRQRYGEYTPPGKRRPENCMSYVQLAKEYGVSPSVIYEAVRGITWKHVE